MKLLLDENLPQDFRHFIAEHEVFTVGFMGWSGLKNGQLLVQASKAGFHALITKDLSIEYQQSPRALTIAILVLHARTNTLDDLRPLVSELLRAIVTLTPGAVVHVGTT